MGAKNVFEHRIPIRADLNAEDVAPRNRRVELVWEKSDGSFPFSTISVICPFCNKEVAAIKHIDITQGQFADTEHMYIIAECPVCMKPIIYDTHSDCTYPSALQFENVKNLPNDVQTVYDECRKAYSAGCFTASVILARTLLNHVAVDKGAEENLSFKSYVDYLVENYMPPKSQKWVDTIRLCANDSTHHLEILEKNDAEQVIKFVMYLLKYIYELPEELI
ncbi:MAG: DUF4145 domain-containing protein [Bacteroidia bacterium]|nr:DUF4145 domain-containing protein [Bacteroidia bacterium]